MNMYDSVRNVRRLPAAQVNQQAGFAQLNVAMRHGHHLLLRMAAIIAFAGAVLVPAFAGDGREGHWTGTWAAAPAFAQGNTQYSDQTLRFIVHTSLGGSQVRVRFSNAFGSQPLKIGATRPYLIRVLSSRGPRAHPQARATLPQLQSKYFLF